MTSRVIRHGWAAVGTGASRIGKLRLAPDDHSDDEPGWRHPRHRSDPAVFLRCVTTMRSEVGSTLNLYEGADMAKNTRAPARSDSGTRETGVNITLPKHAGPVSTTQTTR